jgi:hypothetical protein
MNKNRVPPECCIWPLRGVNGPSIGFASDGELKLMGILRGYTIVIPRKDARLLARRINRALEYYAKRSGR